MCVYVKRFNNTVLSFGKYASECPMFISDIYALSQQLSAAVDSVGAAGSTFMGGVLLVQHLKIGFQLGVNKNRALLL